MADLVDRYFDYEVKSENAAGNSLGRITRRQQLKQRRFRLATELQAVDKAIEALDAHPELEEFIETLSKAGA